MAKITSEEKGVIKAFIQATNAVPVGVDISKDHFQICYRDPAHGFELKNFQLDRQNFMTFVTETQIAGKPMCIAIEACGACNFWSNFIRACGHKSRILHVNKVKAYIGGNKNDRIDAVGIYQCLIYSVRSIKPKEPWQIAVSNLLTARRIVVKVEKQVCCAARAMLYEQGHTCNMGNKAVLNGLEKLMMDLIKNHSPELETFEAITHSFKANIEGLNEELDALNSYCSKFAKHNDLCKRLMTIPGIGVISAVAMFPALSKPDNFPSSRHFASYAGVAPLVTGTGGVTKVLGIRHGNSHIKAALFMAAIGRYSKLAADPDSQVSAALARNKPQMVIICAIANRMARVAWAIAKSGGVYDASKCRLID